MQLDQPWHNPSTLYQGESLHWIGSSQCRCRGVEWSKPLCPAVHHITQLLAYLLVLYLAKDLSRVCQISTHCIIELNCRTLGSRCVFIAEIITWVYHSTQHSRTMHVPLREAWEASILQNGVLGSGKEERGATQGATSGIKTHWIRLANLSAAVARGPQSPDAPSITLRTGIDNDFIFFNIVQLFKKRPK